MCKFSSYKETIKESLKIITFLKTSIKLAQLLQNILFYILQIIANYLNKLFRYYINKLFRYYEENGQISSRREKLNSAKKMNMKKIK